VSQMGQYVVLSAGTAILTLTGDAGGAITPVANNVTIAGGTNIGTVGTAGTITINLDDNVTLVGYLEAGGDITTTGGDLNVDTGDVVVTLGGVVTGAAIEAGTTVTAGTGITATTGDITASTGDFVSTLGAVDAATTVTAGTGITATTGDITASTGDFVSTLGAVDAATTVTAGTGITATTGDITASTGDFVSTLGAVDAATTVTAGTGITATTGDITASTGDFIATLGSVYATTFDTYVAAAGVTLSGTSLLADGTDANIDINITAKGSGQVIIDDLQLTTDLAVTEGGTGVSALTDHCVFVGSGTAAVTVLAVGATGEAIMGSTAADPGWTGSPSFSGTVTAATGMIITANDLTISSGKILLPATTSTDGQITLAGSRFFHAYGTNNLFWGIDSGTFLTTGTGENVGIGHLCLHNLSTGSENVGIGPNSFADLTTGIRNCTIGRYSQNNLAGGSYNCAIGVSSLFTNISGEGNMSFGYASLYTCTGDNNTAIGTIAGWLLTGGDYNTMIGPCTNSPTYTIGTGSAYTGNESSNILFSNTGVNGESNTIHIGTQGTGNGQQDTCYIAGIYGVTVGGTNSAVLIDNTHMLGTVSSSLRYKDNIQDMSEESSGLLNLRPVIFNWKKDKNKTIQYGLIAEEVHELMPGLVNYDDEGKPDGIRYHDMPAMLLNEIKKLQKRIEILERS